MNDYDEECAKLAEHFLCEDRHNSADTSSLAQAIQFAVEDWFSTWPPYLAAAYEEMGLPSSSGEKSNG